MSDTDVKVDTRKLDKLIRTLKLDKAHVRIGVLGTDPRNQGQATNAQVGAAHEYGTTTLPKRSFLRMPLTEELDKKLYVGGKFDPAQVEKVIKEGSTRTWMERIALLAEQVVQEAFDTGGFGKWKRSKMNRKKNHQTLVETQQLRRSITAEVQE